MDMKKMQWQGYWSGNDIMSEKYIDLPDGKSSYAMICSSYFENDNIWYTTFWNDLYKDRKTKNHIEFGNKLNFYGIEYFDKLFPVTIYCCKLWGGG